VVRVIKRGFKVGVGVGGQPLLFDEIDNFSQADRRDGDLTSGCGGIVDELSSRNGQPAIIEKLPKGGVRVCDGGDRLKLFNEAVEQSRQRGT